MQNSFQQLTHPARRAAATHITGAGISQPAVKVETGNILQGKRTVTGPGKVVQRFGVNVKLSDNFDASKVPIKNITFSGRPSSTYLEGGDPRGTTRHVIAVQLEFAAIKNLYTGKTIEQAAHHLGVPPTIENVENKIKNLLVGYKDKRLHYQGSSAGNSKLETAAQRGLSLMSQSRDQQGRILDEATFGLGVRLAYLGTLDIPPQSVRQGKADQLNAAILLHRQTFQMAHKVPDKYMPSEELALKFANYDGDNYADYAYSVAQADKSGASARDASLFGHFKLEAPRQQQLNLPSSSTPSSQYGLGSSHGGYPSPQLSYYSPQSHGQSSFLSGHTPNPYFSAPPTLFGGGQPGPFNPQHTITSSTGYHQQPPPFLLPPTQQAPVQGNGPTPSRGGLRINDLLGNY